MGRVDAAGGGLLDRTGGTAIFGHSEVAGSPIFEPTALKPGPSFAADVTPLAGRRRQRGGHPPCSHEASKILPAVSARRPAPAASGAGLFTRWWGDGFVPTVRVTRRVHFNAAHRLHNP